MKSKRKWPWYLLLIVVMLVAIVIFFPYSSLNDYQKKGRLNLAGLKDTVEVLRDEKGMAYIYAKNLPDAILTQGFVTAQDRLFQMNLNRLFSSGRISELVGDIGMETDIRMRTIGFRRHAEKHVKILSPETKLFLQRYADGVNAYINTRKDTHHLAFKLAGITPDPWTIEDSLTIMYYMGWDNAGNLQAEIISQMLVDKLGLYKARELFPILSNPDDMTRVEPNTETRGTRPTLLNLAGDNQIRNYLEAGRLRVGSNNWALGPKLSKSGKPIVANDPHLNSRFLPGPWYPCGIFLPDLKAVGVIIPGIPGMVVGRTNHFAIGITNAYGDAQDLFVETLDPADPNRYMEGEKSLPFKVVEETVKIKDKKAPGGQREEKITIRFTRRGPVVSGILPSLEPKWVMTLRWAPFENMWPSLGVEKLMFARSVGEVHDALKWINIIMLNFVFADTMGNIGWHVSSRLPIRSEGDGALPHVVKDDRDHWIGFVPFDENPNRYNPERGWLGTCNHYTVTRDYPHYYSSRVSTSYRYERLSQLLNTPGIKSPSDNWQYQRDTLNVLAKRITPIMVEALLLHEETRALGRILSAWNFHEDPDKVGPTIFHAVYDKFAWLVFRDELGDDLAKTMLNQWTYWQARLEKMVIEGDSPWFDDRETKNVRETRDDLFHKAGLATIKEIGSRLGNNPEKWQWGKLHRLEFVNPIRPEGFGKNFVGAGSHPFSGSADTLYRGMYDFTKPYDVTISASLRMVADLGDEEKVLAVLPGGVSGRLLDPHTTDQIPSFISGEKMVWWFSDKAIKANAESTLILMPF
jgi:penicillin amidase